MCGYSISSHNHSLECHLSKFEMGYSTLFPGQVGTKSVQTVEVLEKGLSLYLVK